MSVDAVVIGSGPNGLAAAIELARNGASVLVREARSTPGGGLRSDALIEPGFLHDVCSACHPMGVLSPFFRSLPLNEHGLEWAGSDISIAHPLDDEPAVLLRRSVSETAAALGPDEARYERLVAPFVGRLRDLLGDALAPLGIPRNPWLLLRFGLVGLRSAKGLAKRFQSERARALIAGCAGHATQPLENLFTSSMALMFLLTGHVEDWPVAVGGSEAISRALVGVLRELGGRIETDAPVCSLADLPPCRVVLFDTGPDQLARMGEAHLPARYRKRLLRYRWGPGTFKVDWTLDEPIPWADPKVARAATVHLGGSFEEIAFAEREAYEGRHAERPYIILVQQSMLDASRAPQGKHTGYAYCHVPANSTEDRTAAIEGQIERFAPGFRDVIRARHTTNPRQFQAYSANYVGGAITGGVADWAQLFSRPVARLDPYSTPNPRLFLCSASTPPGGGVHGMCGYHAARSALRRLHRLKPHSFQQ